MESHLLDILVCPLCKGPLQYDRAAQELLCKADKLAFPVRDGIPVMLENEARSLVATQPTDSASGAASGSAASAASADAFGDTATASQSASAAAPEAAPNAASPTPSETATPQTGRPGDPA